MMLARRKKIDDRQGVPIQFISRDSLREKNFDDKLNFILDKVREDMILVLEESLLPHEKKELIMRSVEKITEDFPGIEFSSLENKQYFFDKMFSSISKNLFGKEIRRGLTIVGNSNVMEKVREDQDSIYLLAKMRGR